MPRPPRARAVLRTCAAVLLVAGLADCAPWREAPGSQPGFDFDCDATAERPCRELVARHRGRRLPLEPSSLVWSPRFGRAILVTDNGNELARLGAGAFALSSFDPARPGPEIEVTPLLSPEQAAAFALFDLEALALLGDRLYALGSLSLHPRDPDRDRWQRNQFVRMDLVASPSGLGAENISHVSERWPDFRDWLISESGYRFAPEAVVGRAEGAGINVEALCATGSGHLLLGFRGPEAAGGGALVLEVELPATPAGRPILVTHHAVPQLDDPEIPGRAPRALRDLHRIPGHRADYYVLLGPRGPEKEPIVLARWDLEAGTLSGATPLPAGVVAEGVAPLGDGRLLLVDDRRSRLLVARER